MALNSLLRPRCVYEKESGEDFLTVEKRIKLETGHASKVSLPSYEAISKMSMTNFESRIELLVQAGASFTVSQEMYIERCRGLLRNREHARASRLKKNLTLDVLKERLEAKEIEMRALQEECEKMRRSCGILVSTNIRLSSELELYRMIEHPIIDKLEYSTPYQPPQQQQETDYFSLAFPVDFFPLTSSS